MFMFEFRLFVCWFNFFACLTFLSYLPVLEKCFNSVLKIVLFWYRETWNIASFMRCRKIIEFSEKIWTSHIWIWSLDALSCQYSRRELSGQGYHFTLFKCDICYTQCLDRHCLKHPLWCWKKWCNFKLQKVMKLFSWHRRWKKCWFLKDIKT